MDWDLSVQLLPFIISILLSSTLLWYLIRRAESEGAHYVAWMMIGQIGWAMVSIVQIATRYRELIILLDHLQMAFIPISSIAWFLFTLEYAGYGDWHRRKILAAVFGIPVVTYILLFTNGVHMLFWSEYLVKFDSGTGLVVPSSTPGLWFWIHAAHLWVLQLLAVGLITYNAVSSWSVYRTQSMILIGATVPVILTNWMYNIAAVTTIDYTPAATAFAAAGYTWGVYRHELFDLVPVARDTVLEEMRDAVIVMDRENRIVDINDAAVEILTVESDIVGEPATDVLPFELLETDGGVARKNQELTLGGHGTQKHYRLQTTRMTEDGEQMGTILVLQDVTELKRREQELTRTNQELEQTNEELEILNRIVRHDIQNDMNVVQGHAQLVETMLDEDDQDAIEPVLHNTQHAIELTETVRDLINAAIGDEELEMEAVDLIYLLEQEIERARVAHEEATFNLDVPEEYDRIQVSGTTMLSSVITNLRSNAVRHNDTDDPEITVSVDVGEETVTIRVADNGPGVPEDKRDDIFGRGEKGLDSPGSGIGLYLVDTLVDEFGGSVHVEENDPRGAVFVIELRRVTG